MACRFIRGWKEGIRGEEDIRGLKVPLNYFSCGTFFFDGLFYVVQYPVGMKFYHGELTNDEFPSGLVYTDLTLANIICKGCVSVYRLKKPATFILLNNGYNIWKFLNLTEFPADLRKKVESLAPGPPELSTSTSGTMVTYPIREYPAEFLTWICKEAKRDIYAGYTHNVHFQEETIPQNYYTFTFCYAPEYLERDTTSPVDFKSPKVNSTGVIQQYMDHLEAQGIRRKTMWAVLRAEAILSKPLPVQLSEQQKKLIVMATFLHNGAGDEVYSALALDDLAKVEIQSLIKYYPLLFKVGSARQYMNEIGPDKAPTFIYAAIIVSLAIASSSTPVDNPKERSKYFPFVSNPYRKSSDKGKVNLEPLIELADSVVKIVADSVADPSIGIPTIHQEGTAWYNDRIFIGGLIKTKIKSVEVDKWRSCLSGDDSDFRAKLGPSRIIGQGTFGRIYLTSIDIKGAEGGKATLQRMVIKEAVIDPTLPDEYKYSEMVNDILLSKRCPNFLYTYYISSCNTCDFRGKKSTCYTTFMEAADGDLHKYEKNLTTYQDQMGVVYQLLTALYYIQSVYGMHHNDIKAVNIMVQRTPQLSGKYFRYIIRGTEYYILNTGWVFYLADFGVASVFNPIWSNGTDYGYRNAKVYIDQRSAKFIPITTKYLYSSDGSRKPSPKLPWGGTINKFLKGHDPEPDIPVDLNNTYLFPPWEFYGDCQDIIRTIIGGKRESQVGDHPPFTNLTPETKNTLSQYNLPPYPVWKVDMVGFILADRLLDALYLKGTPPQGVSPDMVIDTFG